MVVGLFFLFVVSLGCMFLKKPYVAYILILINLGFCLMILVAHATEMLNIELSVIPLEKELEGEKP